MTTRIPGVLDLRSDGAGAPIDGAGPAASAFAERGGMDAVFGGRGAVRLHVARAGGNLGALALLPTSR